MFRLLSAMLCASAASVQGGSLHGLVLAHNGPSEPALVDIDYTTGTSAFAFVFLRILPISRWFS